MSQKTAAKMQPRESDPSEGLGIVDGSSANSSDAVYESIFNAIVDHRLLPGTKLGEDKLVEALHTTRTRVREALNRLTHEKLVVTYPYRGAFVAEPSITEAYEILEARRTIEAATIKTLATNANAEHIAKLEDCVSREQEAWTTGRRKEAILLSRAFHLMIADLAGNSVLSELLRHVIYRMSVAIALYDRPGRGDCFFGEHIGLLDAVKAKDPNKASEIMMRHFDHMTDQLKTLDDSTEPRDLSDVFRTDL